MYKYPATRGKTHMTHLQPTVRRRRRGFTLMELLIVIGILAFLLTMLIPVVNRIRGAGYKANTAAQINALRSGCEAYYQTFQAYPGPLPDSACTGVAMPSAGGNPTMSENLVLGLLGGIAPNGAYDYKRVGQGPLGLGATTKQYKPFYEGSTQLSAELGKLGIPPVPGDPPPGRFADERRQMANDSNIPEFVDRYTEPLPILYLRARRGAPGVVTNVNNETAQYDVRHVLGYTGVNLNGKTHGLRSIANPMAEPKGNGPIDADDYLQNPAEYGSGKLRVPDTSTTPVSTPRAKDSYILIGAGADRIFGTYDDITSFGSVLP
jgi:prepilin-type N-terminal cleavage/methylation domain-containing protein